MTVHVTVVASVVCWRHCNRI